MLGVPYWSGLASIALISAALNLLNDRYRAAARLRVLRPRSESQSQSRLDAGVDNAVTSPETSARARRFVFRVRREDSNNLGDDIL
jgi:hypothetical protein